MKYPFRITGLIFVLLSVLLIVLSAFTKTDHNTPRYAMQPSDSIPAEVQSIINATCINCHAPGGKGLAMAKLNFSEWSNYDEAKQIKKAQDMCDEVSKRSMPPRSYVKDHPDQALTPEQIEAICEWAQSISKVSADN